MTEYRTNQFGERIAFVTPGALTAPQTAAPQPPKRRTPPVDPKRWARAMKAKRAPLEKPRPAKKADPLATAIAACVASGRAGGLSEDTIAARVRAIVDVLRPRPEMTKQQQVIRAAARGERPAETEAQMSDRMAKAFGREPERSGMSVFNPNAKSVLDQRSK